MSDQLDRLEKMIDKVQRLAFAARPEVFHIINLAPALIAVARIEPCECDPYTEEVRATLDAAIKEALEATMSDQPDLFGHAPPTAKQSDPPASWAGARAVEPKRDTHAAKILARLRRGPVTASELAQTISWRAAARIKDLRDKGHKITTTSEDGMAVYKLERDDG